MSANGDAPVQRKSTRPRQKRSLGDDFYVPAIGSTNARNSPAPEASSSQSSSAVMKKFAEKVTEGVVKEIKQEVEAEKVAAADFEAPRRSVRQVRPSPRVVVAERKPSHLLVKEVKPEFVIQERKPVMDHPPVPLALPVKYTVLPSSSNSMIARCPSKIVVHPQLRRPPNASNANYVFPKPARMLNRLHAKNYNPSVTSVEDIVRQERYRPTPEEEMRLNEETAAKVAEIRAANVKKILDKRSVGRISTGRQAIAQDQEISRHMATTASNAKQNYKKNYEEGTIGHLLRNQLPSGSSNKTQFIKVSNRTVAVPPGREAHLTVAATPLRIAKVSHQPRLPVGTGIVVQAKQQISPVLKVPKTEEADDSPKPLLPTTTTSTKKFFLVSNHHYQKAQNGGSPTAIRTITVMPQNSMHLGKDGSPPGPSNAYPSSRLCIPREVVGMPPRTNFDYEVGPNGNLVRRVPSTPLKSLPPPMPRRRVSPSHDHTYAHNPNKDRKRKRTAAVADNLVSANSYRKADNTVETEYRPANVDPKRPHLHPHQPQILDPTMETQEEKKVLDLLDVKDEPIDNYSDKMIKEEIVDDISDYFMGEEDPSVVDTVVKEEIVESAPSPTVKEESPQQQQEQDEEPEPEPRSPSPDRIYLGSKEPMKDLDNDRQRFSRYTITRVKQFTARDLRPFGKRPPSCVNKHMQPGAKGLSVVLLPDLSLEGREDEEEEEVDEAQLERERKIKEEELRQQQALTSRYSKNTDEIWEYMHSEEYMKKLKPESEMTKFERILCRHDAFAKIPAFSEKLSKTNPKLFANLLRISGVNQDKEAKAQKKIIYKRDLNLPPRISGPIKVDMKPEVKFSSSATESNEVKLLKVIWNDMTAQVPDQISCHLCDDMMRLCMRRSNYRGELREYPAYRCLRKGCQTFRSIKKIIEGEPLRPRKSLPKPERTGYAHLFATDPLRKYVTDAMSRQQPVIQFKGADPKTLGHIFKDHSHEFEDDDELIEWSDMPYNSVPAPYDEDNVIAEYMNEGLSSDEEPEAEPEPVPEPTKETKPQMKAVEERPIKEEVFDFPEEKKPAPFLCDTISS